MRNENLSIEEMRRYKVGKDVIGSENYSQTSDGFFKVGEGKAYAYTTRPRFFSGVSDIHYAKAAFASKGLLFTTMVHETGHAYINKLTRWIPGSGNRIKSGLKDGRLDTVEHLAIKKLENVYYDINLYGIDMKGLNIVPLDKINKTINALSPAMRAQVQSWTEKLYEVFNRKVTYQGISW